MQQNRLHKHNVYNVKTSKITERVRYLSGHSLDEFVSHLLHIITGLSPDQQIPKQFQEHLGLLCKDTKVYCGVYILLTRDGDYIDLMAVHRG